MIKFGCDPDKDRPVTPEHGYIYPITGMDDEHLNKKVLNVFCGLGPVSIVPDMYILYYIPMNAFEQERVVMGIFTSEKKLTDAFSEWSAEQMFQGNRLGIKSEEFVLHNIDEEKDVPCSGDIYVYEMIDVDKMVI
jgi:hypothetical protein